MQVNLVLRTSVYSFFPAAVCFCLVLFYFKRKKKIFFGLDLLSFFCLFVYIQFIQRIFIRTLFMHLSYTGPRVGNPVIFPKQGTGILQGGQIRDPQNCSCAGARRRGRGSHSMESPGKGSPKPWVQEWDFRIRTSHSVALRAG